MADINIPIQEKFEKVPYGQYVMFDENGLLKTDYSPLGLKIKVNFIDETPLSSPGSQYSFNNESFREFNRPTDTIELSDYGVLIVRQSTYGSPETYFEINEFRVYNLTRKSNGYFILN